MSFIIENPLLFVTLLSIAASFLVTLSYKFLTNQETLKRLRQESNDLRKKIKEESKINKDNGKKLMIIGLIVCFICSNDISIILFCISINFYGLSLLILDSSFIFFLRSFDSCLSLFRVSWFVKNL